MLILSSGLPRESASSSASGCGERSGEHQAMAKILYTSDLHFFHRNIIEYCDRPYRTADGQLNVEAMNAALVSNWNDAVSDDDTVRVLGDVSFGKKLPTARILKQLKGWKELIRGNHDEGFSDKFFVDCGFQVYDDRFFPRMLLDGTVLIHSPWKDERDHAAGAFIDRPKGSLTLCGHVHKSWARRVAPEGAVFLNVGVDVRGYRPVTMEELLRY